MSTDELDYRTPPGSDEPGVASDIDGFREQIKGYIRRRSENGKSYVKTAHIATEFNVSSQRVGVNMPYLEDEGVVEVWSDGGVGKTWKITIDEAGEPGETDA